MAARTLLLLLVLASFGAGVAAGFAGRRRADRPRLPPVRHRAVALERALERYEAHDAEAAAAALAAFAALGEAPREDVAEAAWLAAVLDGDPEALAQVVRAWPGTQGAARAAWERVRRAATEAERTQARQAFAEAWPDAWVLGAGRAGGRP